MCSPMGFLKVPLGMPASPRTSPVLPRMRQTLKLTLKVRSPGTKRPSSRGFGSEYLHPRAGGRSQRDRTRDARGRRRALDRQLRADKQHVAVVRAALAVDEGAVGIARVDCLQQQHPSNVLQGVEGQRGVHPAAARLLGDDQGRLALVRRGAGKVAEEGVRAGAVDGGDGDINIPRLGAHLPHLLADGRPHRPQLKVHVADFSAPFGDQILVQDVATVLPRVVSVVIAVPTDEVLKIPAFQPLCDNAQDAPLGS